MSKKSGKLSVADLLETGFSSVKSAEEAAENHFGAKWKNKVHVFGTKTEGFYIRKGAQPAESLNIVTAEVVPTPAPSAGPVTKSAQPKKTKTPKTSKPAKAPKAAKPAAKKPAPKLKHTKADENGNPQPPKPVKAKKLPPVPPVPPVPPAPAQKELGLKLPPVPPTKKTPKPLGDILHKTVKAIPHPVEFVWNYCDENAEKSRKQLLAELDALGVAYHTVRTQYQQWRKAGRATTTA